MDLIVNKKILMDKRSILTKKCLKKYIRRGDVMFTEI